MYHRGTEKGDVEWLFRWIRMMSRLAHHKEYLTYLDSYSVRGGLNGKESSCWSLCNFREGARKVKEGPCCVECHLRATA